MSVAGFQTFEEILETMNWKLIIETASTLFSFEGARGGVAQLGEHLLCKQGVRSSILLVSKGSVAQPVRAHA